MIWNSYAIWNIYIYIRILWNIITNIVHNGKPTIYNMNSYFMNNICDNVVKP